MSILELRKIIFCVYFTFTARLEFWEDNPVYWTLQNQELNIGHPLGSSVHFVNSIHTQRLFGLHFFTFTGADHKAVVVPSIHQRRPVLDQANWSHS